MGCCAMGSKTSKRKDVLSKYEEKDNEIDSQNDKQNLLCKERSLLYGYIRKLKQNSSKVNNLILSEDVIQIIELFTFDFSFNSNPEKCGKYLTFLDNNKTVLYKPEKDDQDEQYVFNSLNRSALFIANVLMYSFDHYKKYEWEITIKCPQTGNGSKSISIYMGYIKHPIWESIDNFNDVLLGYDNEEADDTQFSIHICGGYDFFRLYKYGNINDWGKKLRLRSSQQSIDVKFEDRISLLFDFGNNTVSLFYNDDFIEMIDDKLPKKIIPAISLYGATYSQMISCTKWNICI